MPVWARPGQDSANAGSALGLKAKEWPTVDRRDSGRPDARPAQREAELGGVPQQWLRARGLPEHRHAGARDASGGAAAVARAGAPAGRRGGEATAGRAARGQREQQGVPPHGRAASRRRGRRAPRGRQAGAGRAAPRRVPPGGSRRAAALPQGAPRARRHAQEGGLRRRRPAHRPEMPSARARLHARGVARRARAREVGGAPAATPAAPRRAHALRRPCCAPAAPPELRHDTLGCATRPLAAPAPVAAPSPAAPS